jgi:hypothetical protein
MVMSLIIETLFATTLPDLIEVLLQALSFERHAGAGTTLCLRRLVRKTFDYC